MPKRLRILLVEDNPDTSDLIRNLLALTGHVCQVYPTGEGALNALDVFKPTAVILDVGLPGMSGVEIARAIRARADGDKIALVGYSGHGDAERHAMDAGMDAYFLKPANLNDIVGAIEQAINVRAAQGS